MLVLCYLDVVRIKENMFEWYYRLRFSGNIYAESGFFGFSDKCEMCLKIVGGNNYIFYVIFK